MEKFTVKRIISGDTFVIKDKNIGKVKVQIAGITSAISANGECGDKFRDVLTGLLPNCLLYTSPSPRDGLLSRMPSSA